MRDTITQGSSSTKQWRIQGRGPGDPAPRLILDQNEARRAEKHFFEPALPPLSEGLDDRPPSPPLYLKVWIRLRNGCLEEGDYALRQLSFKFPEFFISATVKILVILYNVHIRGIRRIFNVEVFEWKPMGLKRVHAPNLSQAISCKSILTYMKDGKPSGYFLQHPIWEGSARKG